ncbi:MAG: hypothetical protein ACJ736_16250 [Streptomyces sp.]
MAQPLELPLHTASLLLSLVLFSAGLQVPVRALGQLLQWPRALLAGLLLHFGAPLLIIPLVAFLLRRSPGTDGGRGDGDQPTMVGIVLASTLVSPLTIPATAGALAPLLSGGYTDALGTAGHTLNSGFALTQVVLPCVAGLACRPALSVRRLGDALRWVTPMAPAGSLVLTYTNASGALGAVLTHPARCC